MTKARTEPFHILSLGAGVQSSTLALMAHKGLITPSLLAAIFADTQAEPKKVYAWLEWLQTQLSYAVHRVTAGSLEEDSLRLRVSRKTGNTYSRSLIPAYIDKGGGKRALMGRKCTAEYKVRAILGLIRRLLKKEMAVWRKKHAVSLKVWNRYVADMKAYKAAAKEAKRAKESIKIVAPEFPTFAWEEMQADPLVIQWVGISTDEAHRMKPSRDPWAKVRWPLIEMGMSRDDCLKWMQDHGYPEPPRSACRFCPFHSDAEWIRLRDEEPEEFWAAVEYEKRLQEVSRQNTGSARFKGEVYLHSSLVPLDQVVFKDVPSHQQVNLFGNECEGLCGV